MLHDFKKMKLEVVFIRLSMMISTNPYEHNVRHNLNFLRVDEGLSVYLM